MTNVTIEEKVKQQGDLVRKLKSQKAEKEKINEEVAKLKALKEELSQASKPAPNPELEAKCQLAKPISLLQRTSTKTNKIGHLPKK